MITESLKTDRQVFDFVRSHLLKQDAQSMYQSGHCVYRGPNGMSCAVGCLISDENYDEDSMENEPVDSADVANAVMQTNPDWKMTYESIEMLRILQQIHDNLTPYTWKHDLDLIEGKIFEDGSDSVKKGLSSGMFHISFGGISDNEEYPTDWRQNV